MDIVRLNRETDRRVVASSSASHASFPGNICISLQERIASFFLLLEFEKTSNKKKQQADYSEKRTDKRGKKKEYLDGRKIVPKGSGTNAPRKGFCFNGSTSSEGGGARRKEDNRGSSEGLCSSLLKPCIYKRR